MEQLTPGEWAKEQLKRAPSFAIATLIVALLLLMCAFIEYSTAQPRRDIPLTVEAKIEDEPPPEIEDIKEDIEPPPPKLEPVDRAHAIEERDVSPVDTPVDDNVDVDLDFTEDTTTEEMESTTPIPVELTKKRAVIGIGPGTGGFRGRYASRSKTGKRRAARRFGMPHGTDKDILSALRWLKKAQEKETGRWDARKWGAPGNRDAGVSGLALLAFLGYGCTDKRPVEFASTVRRAIQYLIRKQTTSNDEKNGWFGERMYTQGICTMALAEAYALTGRRDCKRAAQAGLDYILRKQPAWGAFGYTGPGNDVSVTGFQIQAIKAALSAGLRVPEEARKKTERFLEIAMCKNYSTPYRINPDASTQPGSGKVTMTAASLTCRLFMGHKRTAPDCLGQAKWLIANDRHLQEAKRVGNLYAIYYLSLSMFNMGGKYWRSWNKAFNTALRARQEKTGPNKGSWPPEGFQYGRHGGRVYTTAMACMALEVYFRYLPSYRSF